MFGRSLQCLVWSGISWCINIWVFIWFDLCVIEVGSVWLGLRPSKSLYPITQGACYVCIWGIGQSDCWTAGKNNVSGSINSLWLWHDILHLYPAHILRAATAHEYIKMLSNLVLMCHMSWFKYSCVCVCVFHRRPIATNEWSLTGCESACVFL